METMNNKNLRKLLVFLSIFCVLFLMAQSILKPKWLWHVKGRDTGIGTASWDEYRSLEKNTLDVMFFGTSHTYDAIDPVDIYKKSGITGYVMAGPGMRMDLTYVALKEALKTQKPKVIYLDMAWIQFDFQQEEAKNHRYTDQMLPSGPLLEYIFHPDSEEMKPLDFLLPFFRYHARWNDLNEEDFKYVAGEIPLSAFRGHNIEYKICEDPVDNWTKDWELCPSERNMEYFRRFVKTCEENQIALILGRVPCAGWHKIESDYCAQIAEEAGLPYVEMRSLIDDGTLVKTRDFLDRDDHLNQYGAEKVDDYLISYLTENFELEDTRGTNTRWNEDLAVYEEFKQAIYDKYN